MATLKRNRIFFFLLAVLFSLVLYGCATIVSGTTQEVTFQSEPEGATVTVNGRPLGKTPMTIQLDKKSEQTLTFELSGYRTVTMPLSTSLDGWFWGNIVIGGLLGSTTDGLSGAVYEYAPSQYFVSLHPLNGIDKPQKAKAREFIVAGYKNIVQELNSTPAEYVNSLLELLEVPQADREAAIKKIKGLSEVYSDIPKFAQEVTDLFIK
ncbi:MAG: PEGA domain-containing protein [Desulfuromonadales bacterium]|nr:PEGA domain-containing protein [Desulfuromonadales bacterium]